jgi:hypothetical protein
MLHLYLAENLSFFQTKSFQVSLTCQVPASMQLLTLSFKQCCESETFISDPVSDPDPAFSEFWIRIRIRIRFQILDLNPDQKQAKTSFSQTKKQIEEVGTAFLLELGRHYEIRPHSKPQIFLGHKYFYRAPQTSDEIYTCTKSYGAMNANDPVIIQPITCKLSCKNRNSDQIIA